MPFPSSPRGDELDAGYQSGDFFIQHAAYLPGAIVTLNEPLGVLVGMGLNSVRSVRLLDSAGSVIGRASIALNRWDKYQYFLLRRPEGRPVSVRPGMRIAVSG